MCVDHNRPCVLLLPPPISLSPSLFVSVYRAEIIVAVVARPHLRAKDGHAGEKFRRASIAPPSRVHLPRVIVDIFEPVTQGCPNVCAFTPFVFASCPFLQLRPTSRSIL